MLKLVGDFAIFITVFPNSRDTQSNRERQSNRKHIHSDYLLFMKSLPVPCAVRHTDMHWYQEAHRNKAQFYWSVSFLIPFFPIVAPCPFTSLCLFTPLSHLSLPFCAFCPADLIKYRTPRTQWRRMASALWPTDWFRSRGILCTQIFLWKSANHHPDRSRAKEREKRKMRDIHGKKRGEKREKRKKDYTSGCVSGGDKK